MYLEQPAPEQELITLDHDQIEALIDRDNAERYQLLYAAAREVAIDYLIDHNTSEERAAALADRRIADEADAIRFDRAFESATPISVSDALAITAPEAQQR